MDDIRSTVRQELGLVLKEVAEGLLSIVISIPKEVVGSAKPGNWNQDEPEYYQMHRCDKCKRYHRVP